MLRFVWAFGRHAEVVGLFLRELGQLYADATQVQAGDFFIKMFGKKVTWTRFLELVTTYINILMNYFGQVE